MRYYNIVLTDPASGLIWQPTSTGDGFTKGKGPSTFTSFVNGKTIPGALNIEFDFPVVPFNTPQGQQYVRIWGVGLGMLGQAANLNGANLNLSAGMQKGLPLANPAQAGLILQGTVFQAFGNWEGTNQSIDLICNPGAAFASNIFFNWDAGIPLASAIYQTLSQSFPTYQTNVNISGSLVLSNTEPGHYDNLSQFASYLNELTQEVGSGTFGLNYPGVQITVIGNTIYVYDGTGVEKNTNIVFQDLIGQPTWIGSAKVSFKTVLRSDIAVGSEITFPQGIQAPYALTSQAAAMPNAPASSKTAFQGTFTIIEAHHFANFRQADAASWTTAYVATPSLL